MRAASDALPDTDRSKATLAARTAQVETAGRAGGVANITSNNPILRPEVSRSASLGLVFEPTKALSFCLGSWNIHRKDEISLKRAQELLAAKGALPPGSSTIATR